MRALRSRQQGWLASCGAIGGLGKSSSFPPRSGPFAGAGALVTCFRAVVETVSSFAGFAAKWEEVELIAIGVLAVGTYCFEVLVHGCEGLGFGWLGGGGRGRHDGQDLWVYLGGVRVCRRVGSIDSSARCHEVG